MTTSKQWKLNVSWYYFQTCNKIMVTGIWKTEKSCKENILLSNLFVIPKSGSQTSVGSKVMDSRPPKSDAFHWSNSSTQPYSIKWKISHFWKNFFGKLGNCCISHHGNLQAYWLMSLMQLMMSNINLWVLGGSVKVIPKHDWFQTPISLFHFVMIVWRDRYDSEIWMQQIITCQITDVVVYSYIIPQAWLKSKFKRIQCAKIYKNSSIQCRFL